LGSRSRPRSYRRRTSQQPRRSSGSRRRPSTSWSCSRRRGPEALCIGRRLERDDLAAAETVRIVNAVNRPPEPAGTHPGVVRWQTGLSLRSDLCAENQRGCWSRFMAVGRTGATRGGDAPRRGGRTLQRAHPQSTPDALSSRLDLTDDGRSEVDQVVSNAGRRSSGALNRPIFLLTFAMRRYTSTSMSVPVTRTP
jgi:hypothetical protein